MRILIAPDSFKGSLTAFAAAEAMRRGAARACGSARIDVCPLSDGGEGFLEVSSSLFGGTTRHVEVTGPMGSRVEARMLFLPDGTTAVIETALAVGLGVLGGSPRRAKRTTTFGVGELIREALDCQARTIIVGLGGTATTDGGTGMAQALGVRFERADLDRTSVERSSGKASGVAVGGTEAAATPILGGDLTDVTRIDLGGRDQRLESVELVALADVDNPLTGSEGAAFVYAPQKGASEHEVRELDTALTHLASLAGDVGDHAGDGAAGGLGYGLRVFAGAKHQSGIEFVLTAAGFDERLRDCDLVLTGEGRLDGQSRRGKVCPA